MLFFSGKVFYKSNRKLFSCVYISWYKHLRGWENSRQLCKPSTSSRVCITVSNSPNPSCVYIRLCKHGKRFLLLKYEIVCCKYCSPSTFTRLISSNEVHESSLSFFHTNIQSLRLQGYWTFYTGGYLCWHMYFNWHNI